MNMENFITGSLRSTPRRTRAGPSGCTRVGPIPPRRHIFLILMDGLRRYRVPRDGVCRQEHTTHEATQTVPREKEGGLPVPAHLYVSPSSRKVFGRKTDVSQELAADEWGCDDKPVCHIFDPFEHWFLDAVTSLSKRYPQTWTPATHIGRLVRDILLSVRRTSLSSFSALRGSWAEQR